jgi:hypothetical protein
MAEAVRVERIDTPRCANCGVEIPWRPTVHRGRTYCCGGCAQGGPCYCSYDLATLERPPRAGSHHAHGADRVSLGGRQ